MAARWPWLVGAGLLGLYGVQYGRRAVIVRLDNYTPAEFGQWWPMMSPDLLRKLDTFADRWGGPVMISPAPGALGRLIPPGVAGFGSQHNVTRWGEVRAADIMPRTPKGGGMDAEDMRRAVQLARSVGFTGIGAAPDWRPYPGLHVDVRDTRAAGDPATWAELRVDGIQRVDFPIERAYS